MRAVYITAVAVCFIGCRSIHVLTVMSSCELISAGWEKELVDAEQASGRCSAAKPAPRELRTGDTQVVCKVMVVTAHLPASNERRPAIMVGLVGEDCAYESNSLNPADMNSSTLRSKSLSEWIGTSGRRTSRRVRSGRACSRLRMRNSRSEMC